MSYDSLYNPTLGSTSTLPSAKSHSTTSSASSTTPKITPYNSNFDLSILNSLPNKKRFFPVKVEVHPRDCAVILHFAVQTEKEVAPLFCQKILNLHPYITSLQVSAASILNELTTKYKFLDRIVKLSQLENAILQLQQRPISSIPESSSRKSRSSAIYTAFSIPKRAPSEEVLIRRVLSPSKDLDDENEVASIEMIDEYIELLYENLPEKLKSAKLILSLALRQELLPTLVHNVSLFSAMSRTLREDTKKNLDLMATLITFFHQFVKHPLYLPYLTEHKLGDLCMKLLDQELKRKEIWDREPPSIHLQQKQDVVIYHCVSMLYHMAKEIYLQVKMSHRQLAALLCEWMKPSSIVLPFLTLLSQYYENKEQLKWIKEPLVPKLIPLLHQPCTLVDSLKLLINLSHDRTWQEEMISAGLVVVLVDLFESSDPVPIELELLMYQLSTDDRTKSIFSYTPIMSLVCIQFVLVKRNPFV
ncbi:Kinesin-associated protein 3 [Coelomomyces lativittatus]|nr:Kinesin-associated protein 3 [Coelomomyces lativittatus]